MVAMRLQDLKSSVLTMVQDMDFMLIENRIKLKQLQINLI